MVQQQLSTGHWCGNRSEDEQMNTFGDGDHNMVDHPLESKQVAQQGGQQVISTIYVYTPMDGK